MLSVRRPPVSVERGSALEFASCYDQSGIVLASLNVTAVLIIVAAFAAARLIAMSRAMPAQLQAA